MSAKRQPDALRSRGRERLLGAEHPDTLKARAILATSYNSAGRTNDSIDLLELVLADSERLLGDGHPNTQTFRANLNAMLGRSPDTAAPSWPRVT